ncbi:type I-E CRISPR-associated protein Cas5/CasD [Streptomyces sp. N2A]|uniref:type I-E CRISPR-associated protein Cas5/CasD n=1 Tax=Streptomyces sp. N2A TaxID=3073936 RepID=UPI00286FF5CC|nr:type I-E CRISPR-associated protein Cas5/CasD [Streptomyces sp. N2A]
MSVLTLLLAGPLQSWGASSRFTRRTTEAAPTKSGVIGLLAAAKGIDRKNDAGLADLAGLRFAVRIDQPGTRQRDFQTAHHAVTGKAMPLTERFYLSDAVFVAAVEGGETLVRELHDALRAPVYTPYLGRRSCPPARPVDLQLHTVAGLHEALELESWQAAPWYQRMRHRDAHIDLVTLIESQDGTGDNLRDQPLSFSTAHRRHMLRTYTTSTIRVPNPCSTATRSIKRPAVPVHDPFSALEEEND